MANRVLFDENGLRVSYPGIDVTAASLANLMFRSDATHVPRFIIGSVSRSSGGDATFSYGKTFNVTPIVTWYFTGGDGTFFGGVGSCVVQANPMGHPQPRWRLIIGTSSLLFRTEAVQSGTLNFKVWDFEA